MAQMTLQWSRQLILVLDFSDLKVVKHPLVQTMLFVNSNKLKDYFSTMVCTSVRSIGHSLKWYASGRPYSLYAVSFSVALMLSVVWLLGQTFTMLASIFILLQFPSALGSFLINKFLLMVKASWSRKWHLLFIKSKEIRINSIFKAFSFHKSLLISQQQSSSMSLTLEWESLQLRIHLEKTLNFMLLCFAHWLLK